MVDFISFLARLEKDFSIPARIDTQKTIAIVMVATVFKALVIERMFVLAPSSDCHFLVGVNADFIRGTSKRYEEERRGKYEFHFFITAECIFT